MIRLTGLDNKEYILNSEQIEKIEEVPECVITLINGKKYIVQESSDEIINKVISYKKKIFNSNIK